MKKTIIAPSVLSADFSRLGFLAINIHHRCKVAGTAATDQNPDHERCQCAHQ